MRQHGKRWFGILLSLVMVLGLVPGMGLTAYAGDSITVTWSGNDIPGGTANFSKDNVTLSGANFYEGNVIEGGTFTTTLGNFTKIAVAAGYTTAFTPNYGSRSSVWEGNASSVTVPGWSQDVTSITFTIVPTHDHSFTYSASGAAITATCTADGCTLPPSSEGGTDHVATLTIGAPTLTYVGQTGQNISAEATITDANGIKGSATVKYYNAKADGTDKDGQELGSAPTDAGKYWAEITLGTGENAATAHVVYNIGYTFNFDTHGGSSIPMQVVEPGQNATRPTTNPTNGNLIFGDWYTDDSFTQRYSFTEPVEANTTVHAKFGEHTVTWVFHTNSAAGSYTVRDVFTGQAPAVESLGIMIDICTGEDMKPAGATFVGWKTETDVSGNVTYTTVYMKEPTAKTLSYTGQPQELVNAGEAEDGTMYYAIGTDDQTAPSEGWDTSIPTATDAGTYYVWYKAVAKDDNYVDSTPVRVEVTINAAQADGSSTTKPLTYDGNSQALVVPGEVIGGKLFYALGVDNVTAPVDGWSETVPTATEPGTYYVWYKVEGDENHKGTAPACVVVTIDKPINPAEYSDFTLLATLKTSGKKALKLSWTAVEGAEGYDVFFGRSSETAGQYLTSVTGQKYTVKKLLQGIGYRASVQAWRTVNGQKTYIGQPSPDVFAVTNGKTAVNFTNPKKISVKKKKMALNVGGTKAIKASVKKAVAGRKYLNKVAKVRYFSSDRRVATVDAKGNITAVGAGTCQVFAVAENGLRVGVNVTVK